MMDLYLILIKTLTSDVWWFGEHSLNHTMPETDSRNNQAVAGLNAALK